MSAHFVTAEPNSKGGVDFKTVKPLPEQEKQIATIKEAFEKRFGTDTDSRNAEQWRNLVSLYGMEQVCKTEKMKEKQVKKKMK